MAFSVSKYNGNVDIMMGGELHEITPEEARTLARQLLQAADEVDE